jgi:hypothetical protein
MFRVLCLALFLVVPRAYAQPSSIAPLFHWKDPNAAFVSIDEHSSVFDEQPSLKYIVPVYFSGPVLPEKDALKLFVSHDLLWTAFRFREWLKVGMHLDFDKWVVCCSINPGGKSGLRIFRPF